jgi:hypothetical protein
MLAGTEIPAPPTFDRLAEIVTDPADTPVTGTETIVAPVPKLTVAGTVATVGSLELRLTVRGTGANTDRLSVRFCVAVPLIVRLAGEKLMVGVAGTTAVTCTCPLAVG